MKLLSSLLSISLIVSITTSCVSEGDDEGPGIGSSNSWAHLPLRWDRNDLPLTVEVDQAFNLPAAAADSGYDTQLDLFEEMQELWNDADDYNEFFDIGHGVSSSSTVTANLDDFYDTEVEYLLASLTSMLEPIMIVGMGGIVGFIVISVFLPLYQLIGNLG